MSGRIQFRIDPVRNGKWRISSHDPFVDTSWQPLVSNLPSEEAAKDMLTTYWKDVQFSTPLYGWFTPFTEEVPV